MALIKSKYRVLNEDGTYDIAHFETDADQVITNEDKQFVGQEEKKKWDAKSDAHNHPYRPDTWSPTPSEIGASPETKVGTVAPTNPKVGQLWIDPS